jgi:hypothetical protein
MPGSVAMFSADAVELPAFGDSQANERFLI